MAELNITFKAKKTFWFYLTYAAASLKLFGLLKFMEGKPLANLYVGGKSFGTIKFKISDFV